MTRFSRILAFCALPFLTCAENDQRLRLMSAVSTPRGLGSECVATGGGVGAGPVARGIMDLAAVDAFKDKVPVEYRVFAQVENAFIEPGTGDLKDLTPSPAVAKSTVVITDVVAELNVDLQRTAAGSLRSLAGLSGGDLKFRTPVFARLEPAVTALVPGVGVSESAARKLAAVRDQFLPNPGASVVIMSRLRVLAKKNGSEEVESSFIDLPIELCNGCLFKVVDSCTMLSPSDTEATGSACGVTQDYRLTCCRSAADLVCPAMAPAMGM